MHEKRTNTFVVLRRDSIGFQARLGKRCSVASEWECGTTSAIAESSDDEFSRECTLLA